MGGGVGFVMPYLSNKRLLAEMSIALVMAIVATLTLEHSQIDLMVADWFYLGMGHWMVAKQAFLPDLLLYSGLKKLLMAMLIYLLVATICRAYHEKKGNAITAKWLVPVTKFRVRELAYLVLTLILVPTVVASLKAYTHVVCPVHLTIFDGTLPYLPMLDSMRNTIPDKCFPAAHASSGFALFAFAFAPSLRRRRGAIIIVVMALGWAMGCYKMIIGDHFLSHTVVSMMLAWAMSAGLAWVFFKKGEQVYSYKIQKKTTGSPGRRECQICQSNFIRQYKCRYASTAEGALKANGSSASSWKVTYSQASCFARTACSSLLFSA